MTEIQQVIQDALLRYRGIRRKRAWLAAFAAVALIMALAALLDRTWMFSGWARWSGWVAGLAVAAWAARRAAGLACPDASTLAHQVEAEAGETAPVVATAIDPAVRQTGDREALAGVLLARLDRRAAETIQIAPPTFRGRLRAPAAVAAAAASVLAVLVMLQGGKGLLRMLIPWQALTYTSLALEGPAGTLAEGKAFTLTARVSGVPVRKVTLYRQNSPRPLAEAAPDPQGLVRLTVDGLDGPAYFVVRGGDGQSAPLRVEPYALPAIRAFEITVTLPAYAAHTARTETVPSFSVVRGSRLRYRLHLKAPAVAVALERSAVARKEERVSPADRATLKRDMYGQPLGVEEPGGERAVAPVFHPDPADPLVWETDWALPGPEAIVYRLAIKGGRGDLVRNDEPWRINVLSDAPPTVRILGHNGDEVIHTGKESVRFDLSAEDDVRLARVRLVFRKPGSPHTRQEIELPPETGRAWSGAVLLALAPLDLRPLDIVAVHAEAEDSNTLDGPGVGRSEVVFLEVPLPESANDGGGGGGGGGGMGPINPLEIQKEILKATIVLPADAPTGEQKSLAHDQRQNAEYAGMMAQAATEGGASELAAALLRAQKFMGSAARVLDKQPPGNAVRDEEAALGALVNAAQLLLDPKTGLPQGGMANASMSFTLSSGRPSSSAPKDGQKDGDKARKSLRDLMEEVQRQLAQQKELNQASGNNRERANRQQSLAQDARSAAGRARGLSTSSGHLGDPRAAAEELDRAAGLQTDNSEALGEGNAESSARLGKQSAEALAAALQELAAQLKARTDEGQADAPGYERLISDYLRSISYE